MAQKCEKLRWPIDKSINVHGNVSAHHETNCTLLLTRQSMEHLANGRGGLNPKSCLETRNMAAIKVSEENQDLGRRKSGNTGATRTEQHSGMPP